MSIIASIVFILFFGVLIFGGSHLFLYFSILRFFQISDSWWKSLIAVVLIVLISSFLISSFLAHWKDNVFTRNLYTLSATWLGFLVYFVLAFLVAWAIILACEYFHIEIIVPIVGILAVTAAIAIGIYGLWNAANPRIIEQTVAIKGLPAYWQGKKVVQISDVHMGHTLRQDFLWEIIDRINQIHPEALLITGDFYDGMDGNLEHLAEPLNNVNAKYGTYYVDGNHETYLGTARSLEAIAATKVTILHDSMKDIEWLQIAGVQFPEPGVKKDPLETLRSIKGFDIQKPYIFLYHKPWRIVDDGKLGNGLALFWHTHDGQLFPFAMITKAIFGAFSYGYHKIAGLSTYTSSGIGTWGPPMRVGTIPEIVVFTLENDTK